LTSLPSCLIKTSHLRGVVAQLVEHHNGIVGVRGSTPLGSTKFFFPDSGSGSTFPLSPQDQHVILDIWRNGCSLHQVWDLYKLLQLTTFCKLSEAIESFLKHLEDRGRCQQYRYEFSRALKHLLKAVGDTLPVSQHTTKTLLMSCQKLEQDPTFVIKVNILYNWCKEQGYTAMDITVEKPYRPAVNEIETLSNRQVRALIDHCDEDLLGHLWLCLCLGLRRAEATKVDKLTCRDNYLIVGAEAAKTKTRRVIPLLSGHTKYWQRVQPLPNLRKRMERLKREAGIVTWPRNCMRHTAASHWLNHYQDEAKAALHLGHSPTMLHRHYKALVTRKESDEFFALWS
jgi:integrase